MYLRDKHIASYNFDFVPAFCHIGLRFCDTIDSQSGIRHTIDITAHEPR
jgi:hypothetical protein